MKNPLVSKFLETIKRAKPRPTPKFKAGDVITNIFQGKRIVSEVIKVDVVHSKIDTEKYIEMNFEAGADNLSFDEIDWNGPNGQYTLKDLVNEHKVHVKNMSYNRYRPIQNIDAKYDKMNSDTARILYGKSQE